MGRRKIAIAPSVTFGKRKTGLFKKAYELSVLCNCEIALIVYGSNGKYYEFSSHGMDASLHRYSLMTEGPAERKGPADYADFAAGTLPKKGVARGGSKVPAREQSDEEDEEDDYDDEAERRPAPARKRSAAEPRRSGSSESYAPAPPPGPPSVGSSHSPAQPAQAAAPLPPPPFMAPNDAAAAAMMAHYWPSAGMPAGMPSGPMPPHIPSGVFLPPPFMGISSYAQQAAAMQAQQMLQLEAMQRLGTAGGNRPALRVQTEHPQAGPSNSAGRNGSEAPAESGESSGQYATALRTGSNQPDPVFGYAERTPLSASGEVGLTDYLAFFQSPQAAAAAAMAPLQYQQAQFQADTFKWPVFNAASMGAREPPAAAAPKPAQPPDPNPMDSLAEASASRKRSIIAAAGDAGPAPDGQPADGAPDGQSNGGEGPEAKRSRASD